MEQHSSYTVPWTTTTTLQCVCVHDDGGVLRPLRKWYIHNENVVDAAAQIVHLYSTETVDTVWISHRNYRIMMHENNVSQPAWNSDWDFSLRFSFCCCLKRSNLLKVATQGEKIPKRRNSNGASRIQGMQDWDYFVGGRGGGPWSRAIQCEGSRQLT